MPPTRRPHPAMANPKTFLPRLVPALLLGGAMASAGLLPASGDLQAQEIRIPQGAQDQVVDRIAAVVGDSVIFMTQVEEGIIRRTVTTGQPMPTDPEVLQSPDNLCVSPNTNALVLCEDGAGKNLLRGVTLDGQIFDLAELNSDNNSEVAGATFSPDGRILFFNVQNPGITYAITGPWENGAL